MARVGSPGCIGRRGRRWRLRRTSPKTQAPATFQTSSIASSSRVCVRRQWSHALQQCFMIQRPKLLTCSCVSLWRLVSAASPQVCMLSIAAMSVRGLKGICRPTGRHPETGHGTGSWTFASLPYGGRQLGRWTPHGQRLRAGCELRGLRSCSASSKSRRLYAVPLPRHDRSKR